MIEKVIDFVNELHELAVNNSLIIEVDCFGKMAVHVLLTDSFFKQFKQYDIIERVSLEFPYQATCVIDDVEFYTLLSTEEYQRYVQKNA